MQSYITNLDHYFWNSVNAKTRVAFLKKMARSVTAPLSPTEDPFTQAILKAILLRFSVLSDSIKAMKTPAAFAFTFIFPRRKSQADQKTTHINTPHQWLKTYRFPCAAFFFSPEKRSNNFWPGSQSINAFSTSSAVQKKCISVCHMTF